MKAISFWVKFDEFTNNAHIIDFGNGAGIDNVFIGSKAGKSNTTGRRNSAIGLNSLSYNTIGTDNTANGDDDPIPTLPLASITKAVLVTASVEVETTKIGLV